MNHRPSAGSLRTPATQEKEETRSRGGTLHYRQTRRSRNSTEAFLPGREPFLRQFQSAADRRREGEHADRRDGNGVPGRAQQRRARRPLPSGGRARRPATGRAPQHQHAVPASPRDVAGPTDGTNGAVQSAKCSLRKRADVAKAGLWEVEMTHENCAIALNYFEHTLPKNLSSGYCCFYMTVVIYSGFRTHPICSSGLWANLYPAQNIPNSEIAR